MTAMSTQNDMQQYLDAAYQQVEAWKPEHPNHTQDELEAASNAIYDQAYAEYMKANTMSEGPRLDYIRMES